MIPETGTLDLKWLDNMELILVLGQTGRVYGNLSLKLLDPKTGEVRIGPGGFVDRYDYNLDGSPIRNVFTRLGRPAAVGQTFLIFGYGKATVPVRDGSIIIKPSMLR